MKRFKYCENGKHYRPAHQVRQIIVITGDIEDKQDWCGECIGKSEIKAENQAEDFDLARYFNGKGISVKAINK